MSIKSVVMPYVAAMISSPSWRNRRRRWAARKRKLLRRQPTLTVFIHINDPYSYILLQVLPRFVRRFHLKLVIKPILERQSDMFPEPKMWQSYALQDAQFLAKIYELNAPKEIALDDEQLELASRKLLEKGDNVLEMLKVYEQCYNNEMTSDRSIANPVSQLRENEQLLKKLGHYSSAMIYFESEWYWGVDRLDHLERRLNELGLNASPAKVEFIKTYDNLMASPCERPQDFELDFYWSARSPYSYIALRRTIEFTHFHQLKLNIKPVLPMVMRDLPMPANKKMYIFFDTKREAEKLGIPYGKVADPLGKAVENCYALLAFARQQEKLEAFLLSFANGVNSEGIHGEWLSGFEKIVERAGLDWQAAKPLLESDEWRSEINDNLQSLYSLGLWGVPSYHLKSKNSDDVITWGQDRLVLIEQAIHS